jgi:hypothetical protein
VYRDPFGRQRAKHFHRLVDARNLKADVRMKKQRGEYIDPRDPKTPFEVWAEKYLRGDVVDVDERRRTDHEKCLWT